MKDNNYVIACKGRKEEVNFWQAKANKYADQLEDMDETVCYLKQQVMKLKQEIGKGDYKESCQGKRAWYNTPTEETSTNTPNNKQVPAVRAPQNYSQVLQAPVPTHVQMDIDKEGSGMGQFPALPKQQPPQETMASSVTISCGANWTPARELRPTVGLQGGLRGNMMPQANSLNIRTEGKLDQYITTAHISGSWAAYSNMHVYV